MQDSYIEKSFFAILVPPCDIILCNFTRLHFTFANHNLNNSIHFGGNFPSCWGFTLPEQRLEDDGDVPRSRFADKLHFTSFDQVVISATWNRGRAGLRIKPQWQFLLQRHFTCSHCCSSHCCNAYKLHSIRMLDNGLEAPLASSFKHLDGTVFEHTDGFWLSVMWLYVIQDLMRQSRERH